MQTIQVYDKPMCCTSGVCGPQVDSVVVTFAADVEWIRAQGVVVDRFDLARQTTAFVENAAVKTMLQENGVECLPLVFVNGRLASAGAYPSRESLATWTGIRSHPNPVLVISGGHDGCQSTDCC